MCVTRQELIVAIQPGTRRKDDVGVRPYMKTTKFQRNGGYYIANDNIVILVVLCIMTLYNRTS